MALLLTSSEPWLRGRPSWTWGRPPLISLISGCEFNRGVILLVYWTLSPLRPRRLLWSLMTMRNSPMVVKGRLSSPLFLSKLFHNLLLIFLPSRGPARGGELHETLPNGGAPVGGDFRSHVFVPSWSLQNDSRLYIHNNSIKFSRHAFPPDTITDIEAIASPTLAHNMSYATT